MARIGRWTTAGRGSSLYEVDEEPKAIFGLAEGLLDVSIPIGPDEEVTVHRAPPGFWIGDGALLSGLPRLLSVRAAADCRLFRIPHAALVRSLDAHPGDWMYLHRLSTLNATLCMQTLAEVIALPPRARFARLLLRIAPSDGIVHATQEELGRMAGMSRAAFRRAFRSLIRSGVLETGRGTVRIHDRAALDRAAQDTGG
jgi:CRP-like cAMP-binding protein